MTAGAFVNESSSLFFKGSSELVTILVGVIIGIAGGSGVSFKIVSV